MSTESTGQGAGRMPAPGRQGPRVEPGRRRPRRSGVGRTTWLFSFTDLLCLLLAFFVLSLSMSEPIFSRWQAMFGAAGSPAPGGTSGREPGALFTVATLGVASATNLDYLAALLAGQVGADPALAALHRERGPGELRLVLPTTWRFPADGPPEPAEAGRALFLLGGVLARIGNRVEIVATTDRAGSGGYQQALADAVAVAEQLTEAGVARSLAVRAKAAAPGDPAGSLQVVIRDWQEP